MMTLIKWYKSNLKQKIEEEMLCFLNKFEDKKIRNIISKQIFPSKRIRSYFLFLLCGDQIDKNDFIKVATAIELYHQATLIFDDIIDNDNMRDGNRVALHKQFNGSDTYGDGVASHIALFLIILADMQLLSLKNIKTKSVLEIFNKTKLTMLNSQFADTMTAKKPKNKNYMKWLINDSYQKTSNFIEFPFKMYCLINDMSIMQSKKVISFGTNLGIIYQIGDDLFDIENGIKSGTLALTYPLVFLLDNKTVMKKDEIKILDYILKTRFLNRKIKKDLTLLFKKYAKKINESAYIEIEKRKLAMSKVSLNKEIKNEMMHLLDFIKESSYWKYKKMNK